MQIAAIRRLQPCRSRMLVTLALVGLASIVPSGAWAQAGRFGLGLRAAIDGPGIAAKYYLDPGFSLEAQLNLGGVRILEGRSVSATVMITYNLPLPVRVMRLYFGGGCHTGVWTGRTHSGHPDQWIFGIDGVGGMEVFFRRRPVSISGELKPALNYVREVEFFPHNMTAMTFRYYFGSSKGRKANALF